MPSFCIIASVCTEREGGHDSTRLVKFNIWYMGTQLAHNAHFVRVSNGTLDAREIL